MYLKLVTSFLFSFFVFTISIMTIQADEVKSIKTITKEEAVELAIKNHGSLKILQAKIKSLDAQKDYTSSEINELGNMDNPTISKLPTDFEYFLKYYPEYEQSTEEEKNVIDQLIYNQILINTSLNQLQDGQVDSEIIEFEEQMKLQQEKLNKTIKELDAEKNKSKIELDQTKMEIKYYISQKYIKLLLLETEIQQFNIKMSYSKRDTQDYLVMKKHGLITDKNLENEYNQIKKLEFELSKKEKIYDFYLNELKLELGFPLNQTINLEPIHMEMNKLPIVELENKINAMLNVKKLEENITLAKENHDNEDSSKTNLKDYYYNIWQSTLHEKENLVKEINGKIRELDFEQEEIFTKIEELQKSKELLIPDKKDLEIQFKAGLITSLELEKVDRDIQQIQSEINLLQYEYYLLNEKFTQGLSGHLM